jgi:nitroreductase|tara:strand:+ start:239 stop:760 length:522 start_codon:yes stop_codon:yes gene_type:complete
MKMELKEVIEKRNSIRDYKDTPVPQEKLDRVLEATRLAPSGGNRQDWKFIVVRDEQRRRRLAEVMGGQPHIVAAPVIIAAVATAPDRVLKCGVPTYAVNTACAVDHLMLAATDEGLGTCWKSGYSQEETKDILDVPESAMIVALLTLGFPNEEGREKTRKTIDEIVCYDTFEE